MLKLALVALVVAALIAIQTQKLRRAVIYLGIFSLSISYVYTLYNAPDVAIAEAVVGSTLATILYLVALQKYKVFTVYYHTVGEVVDDTLYHSKKEEKLLKRIEVFCAKQELEPQFIHTVESVDEIRRKHQYAIIIEETDEYIFIYGHPENYKMDALEIYFSDYIHKSHNLIFVPVIDEVEGDS